MAGNRSEYSAVVSVGAIEDTEPPVIVSIYPATGFKLGGTYQNASALVKDNRRLASIVIEYSRKGTVFSVLNRYDDIDQDQYTAYGYVDMLRFASYESLYIRVTATDLAGNTTVGQVIRYEIDITPPVVEAPSASYGDEAVTLLWNGKGEEDLAGYRIYRREEDEGWYELIGQKPSHPVRRPTTSLTVP